MAEPSRWVIFSIWIQVVPILALALPHRRQVPAVLWTALWCGLLLLEDLLLQAIGSRGENNLWVSHMMLPITGSVALWAVSCWARGLTRMMVRISVPVFVGVAVLLTLHVEDMRSFTLITLPFENIVIIFAAVITVVQRALGSDRDPLPIGVILVLTGMIMYASVTTALGPFADYFTQREAWDLLVRAFNIRAGITIVAFTCIGLGIAWTKHPSPSGGSSSPLSLPVSYSSEHSL